MSILSIFFRGREKKPESEFRVSKAYGNIRSAKSKEEADSINRSYRTADHERYQQLDFVVGFNINRSNNPDIDCEICRVGAGKYPKDFIWTGWHLGCKCYVTSVRMTDEERSEMLDKILAGERTKGMASVNDVKDVPEGLKQ